MTDYVCIDFRFFLFE